MTEIPVLLRPFFRMGKLEDSIVLENDLCVYIGHVEYEAGSVLPCSGVIVPRRRVETAFDLSPAEILATFELLGRVKAYLDAIIKPDGYSLGWNCYPVAGQVDPHAHLHVIPRFADEPKAGHGIRYHLKRADNRRPEPLAPGAGLARKEPE
jgi:diadenosine tetraphosphate (Ap4A) HIT family hydrolase